MKDTTLGKLKARGCTSKKRYTLDEVNSAVDDFAEQKIEMYYYHCLFCSTFHLTSSPPSPKLNKVIQQAVIDKFNKIPHPFKGMKRKRK